MQFKELDNNGNGVITVGELRQALLKAGIRLTLEHFDLLVESMDTDHNGSIVYSEFASEMLRQYARYSGNSKKKATLM